MHVLTLTAISLGLAVGLTACRTGEMHFRGDSTTALARLSGRAGPKRFARVNDRIYRGGQPSALHLEELRAAGVTTIIDLRAEQLTTLRDEARAVERLGMEFVHFAFNGLRNADDAFLRRVLSAMRDEAHGRVYVHCKLGRDRTSLMVALYRVIEEGWDPAVAWRREALAYGHRPFLFFRKFDQMFRRMVGNYGARSTSAPSSPSTSPTSPPVVEDSEVSKRPKKLMPSLPSSPPGSASTTAASISSARASSS